MTFIKFGRYVTPDGKYLVMPDLKKLNLPIKQKKQGGMIPILYDKDETAFASNGLGRLRDCLSCIVTEERNGIYECDFEYPVTGANFDEIQLGRIIAVTHDDTGDIQPFDIVSYSRPINGIVTFHAVHISYRQSFLTVTGSGINSLADAFTLLEGASPDNPFTYTTDMTSLNYFGAADGFPHTVKQMLGGIEGSILDSYGGEYEWDGFNVILHSARGQLRSFAIRYGVNMIDFNDEVDCSQTYSSCIPYWTDNANTVVGNMVSSGNTTITGRDECIPLDLSDKFEAEPTQASLESMALSYLTDNSTHLPSQNIKVEFVRLQDMGFEGFEELLQCNLCDTIKVIFPSYNMSGQFKIVKTVWNVLKNRFDSMELGSLSTTLSEALGVDSGTSSGSSTSNTATSMFTTSSATSGSVSIASGATSTVTKTFVLPSPYKRVVGIRDVKTSNNSNCTVSAFELTGDGVIGNTVTFTAYIYNKSSSSRTITVTWEFTLSI